MILLSKTFTGVACALGLLCAAPSFADTNTVLKGVVAAKPNANAKLSQQDVQKFRRGAPMILKGFKVTTFIPIAIGDMSGWTALTNGPAKGGGQIFKSAGRLLIATRGADNDIYFAPVDPGNLGPISEAAWVAAGVSSTSEPSCIGYDQPWMGNTFHTIACAFLGAKGNALYMTGTDDKSLSITAPDDLGGQNAGAAPTFLKPPLMQSGNAGGYTLFDFGVWDGGKALFVRRHGWGLSISAFPFPAPGSTQWVKLAMPFDTAPGCDAGTCIMVNGNHIRALTIPGNGGNPSVAAVSGDLAAGITGKPAVIGIGAGKHLVLVRGKDGKAYRTVFVSGSKSFSGGWKDEGGYINAGASPTCVAQGAQALCVIQGNDGRLYGKLLSGTSGL